jgi:TolB-like protein
MALGTPGYMSPEQAAGGHGIDGRTDIYALGCVAYEMLAGAPPFTGPTAQAIMARHAIDPVPPLRTVRAAVPETVEEAIDRALSKVPADRYASADEFARAIQAERAPSVRRRSRRFRWRRAAAAGAITAIAAGGLGALFLRPPRAAIPADAATIAVLPFSSPTGDSALAWLGRDLAATIGASLDGVGDIRTADRLNIAAEFQPGDAGSLDRAAALARRLGAGSVLRGTLARSGDNVRLDAGLYSAEGLEPLARGISIVAHRDSLAALTDSVVWSLLRQIWQRGEQPSPSLEAVTTRSLPALRAFLEGERQFEQGDMDLASLAYRSAMASDSGFLLAYYGYARARSWWAGSYVEPEVIEVLRRDADKLPVRERLMARAFVADSLDTEVELLREVTRTFPSYWPGWFLLGDLFVHTAPMRGYDWAEGLVALRRAVELHPRLMEGWAHIFQAANGKRQPLADTAIVRLRELGWSASNWLSFRLFHELGRSGGVIGPELRGLADSLVRQYIRDPVDYGKRHGSFAWGFVHAGFPAAQIMLNRRTLESDPSNPDLNLPAGIGIAWAHAARGTWDSAASVMSRHAAKNPGTYVPRRAAEFGDPVLALEAYGLTVLGSWLGAVTPEIADQRRPSARAAIGRLANGSTRSIAELRMAWFDGLLGFARADRRAVIVAREIASRSPHAQREMVGQSLNILVRALSGDRSGAGRELAALEWRCLARGGFSGMWHPEPSGGQECSHSTPEIAVQRLLAARWLQEAGEIEEAVRLLRWFDAWLYGPQTPRTVGHVLAGPTFLARARLEELRGERRRAAEYYRRFLQVYDQPMPSQAHLVKEAKEALARLGEES